MCEMLRYYGYAAKTVSQWTLIYSLHNHVIETCYTWQTVPNLNGSLEINTLALNNCFSYRNVFQNDANALSKIVFKNPFFYQKDQNFGPYDFVQISLACHICPQPDNYRTTSIFAFHNNPVRWVLTNSSEFAIFNTPQPYSVTSDETWSRFISLHWVQD